MSRIKNGQEAPSVEPGTEPFISSFDANGLSIEHDRVVREGAGL